MSLSLKWAMVLVLFLVVAFVMFYAAMGVAG